MTYPKRVLIAIDQLFAVSAMAHRRGWKRLERLINWLFCDDMHCAKAYLSEMEGSQNAPEYQNGKGA